MYVVTQTKKTPVLKVIPRWQQEMIAQRIGLPDILYVKLTLKEIRASLGEKYPEILTLDQAAALAQLAPGTLKRKCSEGYFKESAKRGKPLRFWRDRFVQELMA